MGISMAKTFLIILFFMHVWHGSRLTWIFAGCVTGKLQRVAGGGMGEL
jgi:hypothetical protein